MVRVAALLLVMLLVLSCSERHKIVVVTGHEDFREGDLVLRCGYGAESRAVTASSCSFYSHIGLLHQDAGNGGWMVVHAVPGEADPDAPERLKCEPISQFFSPERAIRGAWMRIDCPDSIAQKAARYALEKMEQGVEFDNDYRLSDTTQLYCTELIWQAYLHQGVDVTDGQRQEAPTFICKDGECIFPIDIERSTKTLFVKPFKTSER